MAFPRLFQIRQHFSAPLVSDISASVRSEVSRMTLPSKVSFGDRVAITAGSRGISHIREIIESVARELQSIGARPFIVPAMGSHGGATASGQKALLEEMGISENTLGIPILSSMEVVHVHTIDHGIPVYFDKLAFEADHVVVINRVKPHTKLSGEIESGLNKMMLIGLGKHTGAKIYHRAFRLHSFDRIAELAGRSVIQKCRILFGLAIVENASKDTALIRAVPPEAFYEEEKKLLALARHWMPHLPFNRADLLIVDEMGKDISGAGMDSNVTGRKSYEHQGAADESVQISVIYVRDLTDASHGNATGIGKAEFAHSQLIQKIDLAVTYLNCITANAPASAGLPIHFNSDREVLEAARTAIGFEDPGQERWIRIRNTMDLVEVWVSEAYGEELVHRDDLEILRSASPIRFDRFGNFADP